MRHIKKTENKKGEGSSELVFPMRINKLLGHLGLGSRRSIDTLISAKRILVNGKPIELGYQAQATDKITFDNVPIVQKKPHLTYILLNKPKGFVTSAADELGRKTVTDLIQVRERIYPIGRLDKDTTGVLLLTNDGDLTFKLSHPKFEVSKEYRARITPAINKKDLEELSKGIMLDDHQLAPCIIKVLNSEGTLLSVELHEGRYRQIRRMFELKGYEVLDLDRTNYAGLTTDGVPMGKWRHLTPKELGMLYSLF